MAARLHRRITKAGTNHREAAAAYSHPAGTGATPMVMPLAQVTYAPVEGYPWGTASYTELHPVWAPDGAMIAGVPGSAPVKVRPAGRP